MNATIKLTDANTDLVPRGYRYVELIVNDDAVIVQHYDEHGIVAGNVHVEMFNGKLIARVWRAEDEGNDPIATVTFFDPEAQP